MKDWQKIMHLEITVATLEKQVAGIQSDMTRLLNHVLGRERKATTDDVSEMMAAHTAGCMCDDCGYHRRGG